MARAPPEPSASESGRISLVVVVEVPPLRTRVCLGRCRRAFGGGGRFSDSGRALVSARDCRRHRHARMKNAQRRGRFHRFQGAMMFRRKRKKTACPERRGPPQGGKKNPPPPILSLSLSLSLSPSLPPSPKTHRRFLLFQKMRTTRAPPLQLLPAVVALAALLSALLPSSLASETCVQAAATLASGACKTLHAAASRTGASVATADCATLHAVSVTMAPQAPPPDDACCADMRRFVESGCGCDADVERLVAAGGFAPGTAAGAARLATVSRCADPALGGRMFMNPCGNNCMPVVNGLSGGGGGGGGRGAAAAAPGGAVPALVGGSVSPAAAPVVAAPGAAAAVPAAAAASGSSSARFPTAILLAPTATVPSVAAATATAAAPPLTPAPASPSANAAAAMPTTAAATNATAAPAAGAAPRPGGISFGAGPPPVFSAATAGLLTAAGKK